MRCPIQRREHESPHPIADRNREALRIPVLAHDWREHIVNLDHLRQYVGLRGYGQRDPLNLCAEWGDNAVYKRRHTQPPSFSRLHPNFRLKPVR